VIALDSSALLAILLNEPRAFECREALLRETEPVMSATTLAESFIVARTRGVLGDLQVLLASIPIDIISVDEDTSARVSEIYARWGKRNHPAELNIIDCFSYDVARQFDCPLLFIGNDFSQTDITSVLA
jgi:ribonuclease VapC